MLSQNHISKLVSLAESKIQSRAAKFLSLKEPLLAQTYNPSPQIANRAKELYNNQIALETELQTALALINDLKTTGFDLSKSVEVGNVALKIDTHMKAAQAFLGQAPATPVSAGMSKWMPQTTLQWGLGIAVIGIGLWLFMGRK